MSSTNFTAILGSDKGTIGVVDSTVNPRLDGWLCPYNHDKFTSIRFKFTLQGEHNGDRSYHISAAEGWAYAGALVQTSLSGWVGLYGIGVVGRLVDYVLAANSRGPDPRWRIRTLTEWDGDLKTLENVEFHLLDRHGQAMSIESYRHESISPSGEIGKRATVSISYADYVSVNKEAQSKKIRFKLRDIRSA
ncbi:MULTISPECIES: hypothetical protein [unclassified Pseudomonas]|uniref:hypothetical protein n=1 Tax=unclassified Pseudomonas TaxID=196821 RepID=UPI000A1F7667|nr:MULTISPECIES: hypothetical protein [unclassified Pseudomonas]